MTTSTSRYVSTIATPTRTRTRSLLRSGLLALSCLALFQGAASAAPFQNSWTRNLSLPSGGYTRLADVVPMKNGGTAVAFTYYTNPTSHAARVIRFDANGGTLWSFERIGQKLIAADTDPAGNLYMLFDGPTNDEIVSVDIAGFLRWSRILEGPPHLGSYDVRAIDVTDAGDVFVAGMGFTPSVWPRMVLHRFDSAGVLAWRWNAAGQFTGPFPYGDPTRVVVGEGGNIFVIGHSDNIQYRQFGMHVVSPNGSTIDWLWGGQPDGEVAPPIAVTGPSGEVALANDGYWVPWGQPAEFIREVVLYRGGTTFRLDLLGTSPDPTTEAIDALEFDASGNLLVATRLASTVRRFDANFVELPSWPLPAGTGRVHDFATAPDGGLFVQASGTNGMRLIRFDASGTLIWIQDRPGITTNAGDRRPTELAVDGRGNVFAIALEPVPGSNLQPILAKWIDGGIVGTGYCGPATPNSSGGPASAAALGATFVADNNVSLLGSGLPNGAAVLWLASTTQSFVPGAGGSVGNLCLGGAVGRFVANGQVGTSDAAGRSSLELELLRIPQPNGFVSAAAGQTWNFQAWFRDSSPAGAVSNFTNAVSIALQ